MASVAAVPPLFTRAAGASSPSRSGGTDESDAGCVQKATGAIPWSIDVRRGHGRALHMSRARENVVHGGQRVRFARVDGRSLAVCDTSRMYDDVFPVISSHGEKVRT